MDDGNRSALSDANKEEITFFLSENYCVLFVDMIDD